VCPKEDIKHHTAPLGVTVAETVQPTRSDIAIRIFSPHGYPLGDGLSSCHSKAWR